MASKSSLAGCDEIKAAKQRLEVARKWEASTAENLGAAEQRLGVAEQRLRDAETQVEIEKDQVKNAKSSQKSACDEVKEAEVFLRSVESKWEVIDVDDTPVKQSKRKRENSESESSTHRQLNPYLGTEDNGKRRRGARAVSLSPTTMRRTSANCVEFDLYAIPGQLGFTIRNSRGSGRLRVAAILQPSQFFGTMVRGDVIKMFDGVRTGE